MEPRRKLLENNILRIAGENPYALLAIQTQILYDIAEMLEEAIGRLGSIGRLESSLAKPKGYIYPIKVLVDRLTVIDFVNKYPYTPLISVTLFNDGPDEVYPSVNDYQRTVSPKAGETIPVDVRITPLKPGESLTIDMRQPIIERLFLDVAEGKHTFIRGFGIY
jgi:hypothetical protein